MHFLFHYVESLVVLEIVNRTLFKAGNRRQVGMLEEGCAAFGEGDGLQIGPPADVVDHGNHRARGVGGVRHAGMP
jgi:hypothetical protein